MTSSLLFGGGGATSRHSEEDPELTTAAVPPSRHHGGATPLVEPVETTTMDPSLSIVVDEDDDDIDKLVYTSEETNNDTVRIVLSTLAPQRLDPTAPSGGQEGSHQSAMQGAAASPVAAKCPPRRVRTISWPWTVVGPVAEVACPVGTRGTARWSCQLSSSQKGPAAPVWEPSGTPDLSECQSTWMGRILADLRKSDAVGTIAADLVQYVAANPLYGGDMAAAVSAMTIIAEKLEYQLAAIPTMEQREAMVVEVVQSLVRTASSLLDVDSLAAWADLPAARRGRSLAAFLAALERTGHLLPKAIALDREVSISSQNVCKYCIVLLYHHFKNILTPIMLIRFRVRS